MVGRIDLAVNGFNVRYMWREKQLVSHLANWLIQPLRSLTLILPALRRVVSNRLSRFLKPLPALKSSLFYIFLHLNAMFWYNWDETKRNVHSFRLNCIKTLSLNEELFVRPVVRTDSALLESLWPLLSPIDRCFLPQLTCDLKSIESEWILK